MKRVAQYDPATGELIAVWRSIAAAARSVYGNPLNNEANISHSMRRHDGTACGYRWRCCTVRMTREQIDYLKEGDKINAKDLETWQRDRAATDLAGL